MEIRLAHVYELLEDFKSLPPVYEIQARKVGIEPKSSVKFNKEVAEKNTETMDSWKGQFIDNEATYKDSMDEYERIYGAASREFEEKLKEQQNGNKSA
jgi:hypothetical protein